jgi:hypothetical protein
LALKRPSFYGFPIFRRELQYQHEHEHNTPDLLKAAEKRRSPYKASWWQQFKAVFWRSFISVLKEPMIMQVRIIQTIVSWVLIARGQFFKRIFALKSKSWCLQESLRLAKVYA